MFERAELDFDALSVQFIPLFKASTVLKTVIFKYKMSHRGRCHVLFECPLGKFQYDLCNELSFERRVDRIMLVMPDQVLSFDIFTSLTSIFIPNFE